MVRSTAIARISCSGLTLLGGDRIARLLQLGLGALVGFAHRLGGLTLGAPHRLFDHALGVGLRIGELLPWRLRHLGLGLLLRDLGGLDRVLDLAVAAPRARS